MAIRTAWEVSQDPSQQTLGGSGDSSPDLACPLYNNISNNSPHNISNQDAHEIEPFEPPPSPPKNCIKNYPNLGFYDPDEDHFIQFRCHNWSCEVCCPRRKRQLIEDISMSAHQYDLTRFLTLTFKDKELMSKMDSYDQYKALQKAWNIFRTKLKHIEKWQDTRFVWVIEPHMEDGRNFFHLHVLLSRYIPLAWITSNWDYSVDIKRTQINNVKKYLTKYFSKSDFGQYYWGSMHRYRFSRDTKIPKAKQTHTWLLAYRTHNGLCVTLTSLSEYYDYHLLEMEANYDSEGSTLEAYFDKVP